MDSKLNLSSYGVEELSQQEMLDVEGGDLVTFFLGLAIGWTIDSVYKAATGESIVDTGAKIIEKAWSSHIEIMEKNPMAFIY
jgi:hypothetical protein